VPITLVTHDFAGRDLFVGTVDVSEQLCEVKLRATIIVIVCAIFGFRGLATALCCSARPGHGWKDLRWSKPNFRPSTSA